MTSEVPQEGLKYDRGKPPMHLLSPEALRQVAKVLEFGATKYEPWNWARGISYSRVYSAAQRHLNYWWEGEDLDPETGISHIAHAACCLMFLLQYEKTKQEYDDRPKEELKNEGIPN